jgi:ribonuclease-3
VVVKGKSYGVGTGRSKKEAEQQAAEAAWTAIRAMLDDAEDASDAALVDDEESDGD